MRDFLQPPMKGMRSVVSYTFKPEFVFKIVSFAIALLVFGCFALAGQSLSISPQPTVIRSVNVQDRPDALSITIEASNALQQPRIERLKAPDRIAFDFAGAIPVSVPNSISIHKNHVLRLRTALHRGGKGQPSVTRVVLDLDQPIEFATFSNPSSFTIKVLGPASASTRSSTTLNRPFTHSTSVNTRQQRIDVAAQNRLNRIEVSPRGTSISVSLVFDQPAKPRIMYLRDPNRMVLDFDGTSYGTQWSQPNRITVNSRGINSIRSSLFRQNPPVLRVVLDEQLPNYRPQIQSDGQTLILKFPASAELPKTDVRATAEKRSSIDPAKVTESAPQRVPIPLPPATERNLTTPATTATQNGMPSPATPGMVSNPPVVAYESGSLYVDAQNSRLMDVLLAIAVKSGIEIGIPNSDEMQNLVILKIGPAKPRDVLLMLLQDSSYNVELIEDANGTLQKVVLTLK